MNTQQKNFGRIHLVRSKPVNLKPGDDVLFGNEWTRKLEIPRIITLHRIGVTVGFNFFRHKFFPLQVLARLSNAYNVRGSIVKDSLKNIFFRSTQHVPRGVWLVEAWSVGYFHWISESLTRVLFYMRQNPEKAVVVLLPEEFKKVDYVSRSLVVLGATPYYFTNREYLFVDLLEVVTPVRPPGNFIPSQVVDLRAEMLARLTTRQVQPTRLIYISRQNAARRKITNEMELQRVLKEARFEIHYFETYTFEQQVQLMAEAKWLFALHGAGLTNMIFMQPGGNVLEIRRRGDRLNNCYFSLANACDLHYLYLEGDKSDDNSLDSNVEVNCTEVQTLLAKHLL